jgi:hypothetical protein
LTLCKMTSLEEKRQLAQQQRKENLTKNLANMDVDASKVLDELKEGRVRRQQKRQQVMGEISEYSNIQYVHCSNLLFRLMF